MAHSWSTIGTALRVEGRRSITVLSKTNVSYLGTDKRLLLARFKHLPIFAKKDQNPLKATDDDVVESVKDEYQEEPLSGLPGSLNRYLLVLAMMKQFL